MPEITAADIRREIKRLRANVERFPALALLLEDAPEEDYDPRTRFASQAAAEAAYDVELPACGLMEAIELAAQLTSRAKKLAALEARRKIFQEEIERLNGRFVNRGLDVLLWNSEMRDLVKDLYVSAYVAGRSGRWSEITSQEWGRLGPILRRQYEHLRGWASELYRDRNQYSLAQMNARAMLYAASAQQAFERAIAEEIGVSSDVLPDWPGSGGTICRSNCRCRWAIRVLSKARGDYDCSWRMASAEHCSTCRQRAKLWKKLRIRGGVLLDPPSTDGTFR